MYANVIRCTYGTPPEDRIVHEVFAGRGTMAVRITDFADPVDASRAARPRSGADRQPGGFGRRIIHQVMDQVQSRGWPGRAGNVLFLTQHTQQPEPGEMSYSTHTEGPYTVICLTGEVDLYRSPAARKQILNLLDEGHNVLVDLSRATYIDSSAVASLVEGYQLARKKRVDFALVGVGDAAMQVLHLARLDKVFPIYDSAADMRSPRPPSTA